MSGTISYIAIIEAQSLVRHGLERVLSADPRHVVVSAVTDRGEFQGAGERPDVILYGPPRDCAEEPRESVAELAGHGKVLVMHDFPGSFSVLDTIRAGALGCVTKEISVRELLVAVRTVGAGGYHVSPELAPRLHAELNRPARPEPRVLARRELETLRWLADGLTHGQIARRMGLTEATVSTYVKRIRSKLDVGNKADLTRTAIELGLLRCGERRTAVPAPVSGTVG
ncbi:MULTISPECIES: response regulator transcription factor [Streptomycetaceae]|uniref:Two-component system response regulator n=1 Tax=Streptantibioticus cattleyicolor (strain ATCC 35852 / DSM 46488 / JCM 4925 / NBRC 14057 / NRRL 8057) TaxID=1003195 RepID=F8JY91_STREN|nr:MULTISPECIES: response regulator transcription factor [Streptomycetaceae]AEW94682.1 two-component system response regulator [Streptantibioticus cattleyicolor NRRL 8057 = DSM 46488]MYS59314.1 DNA-binding response regulator [Streptomyces sp. SID5468]CCB75036.1 putative Two component transcriptional regulator, LuxR family [Streptantibioticus cattleyicolor NRRL 8057 = DSM 46488]